jgi:hypothetical protein
VPLTFSDIQNMMENAGRPGMVRRHIGYGKEKQRENGRK